ncbi:MAG: FtsQ-type POTRA domain-containing protein, partial [Planctomycetota bacterium]
MTGCLAVLAGLGWRMTQWVHETPVFALRQVEISGHVTLDPGEIRALCNVEMATHLFQLDVRRVGTEIERCPRIRRAVVSRRLPDRLAVRIVERVPVAQVLADAWYEIDETGVVLGRVRPEFQHTLPKFLGVCGKQ